MKSEPAALELLLTRLAFLLFGKSVYKNFADRLPLGGAESVLDFGCGMGTVAFYVANKLPGGSLTCLDISERWLRACRRTLREHENVSYLQSTKMLAVERYDIAYCHFVLHDIPDNELAEVITRLANSLIPGGLLVFREPLHDMKKIGTIKLLLEQSGLTHTDGRVTDIPLMGNALESIYKKL